jgi:phosphoribosylformylglycinamidine synthase subunit PurL
VVTVAAKHVKLFENNISKIVYKQIGVVTSGELVIDNDFWGTIDWWQEKYDTAIENYLTKDKAGAALGVI